MPAVSFLAENITRSGYLALPAGGKGPGVLVLHAWWGLTPFFTGLCDRLAAEGFVAFAPDLHHGQTAATIDEAQRILDAQDFPAAHATAVAALDYLRRHEAVSSAQVGAIGFSMGVAFALLLNSEAPDAFSAIVLFYGLSDVDISQTTTAILGHFGALDDWEPIEEVRKLHGQEVAIHIYPEAGHWFFEADRPDSYRPEDAALAWDRTVEFLRAKVE